MTFSLFFFAFFLNIGATIRTLQEIQCLPYGVFLCLLLSPVCWRTVYHNKLRVDIYLLTCVSYVSFWCRFIDKPHTIYLQQLVQDDSKFKSL